MSTPQTVEVQTEHGDVAYEIVTCVNCGADVVPEDALVVGLEFEEYRCSGLPFCRSTHERPIDTRTLCSYCAETVLAYPSTETNDVRRWLKTAAEERSPVSVGAWLGMVLGVTGLVGLGVLVLGLRLLGLA